VAAGAQRPEGSDRSGPARTEQARADEARTARTALVDFLRDSIGLDDAAEAAFRQVPRHLFVPELPASLAYSDESVVVKSGADGTPVSSSSQPTMMAIMLDQLGLRSGHRVLEIGAGTGYNAAVMAHIVGEAGRVVTVDIDAELAARASASLAAAGYGQVRVGCGDGALGFASGGPYDRIIATVGAWDIAPQWVEQLAPGGRIVLPISIRGMQLSVALDRGDGCLISRSAVRCGFIKMAGALAGPEVIGPAGPQPGMQFGTDDGRPLDPAAIYAALNGPAVVVVADLPEVSQSELSDADLWLTLAEPELLRLTVFGRWSRSPDGGPLRPLTGLAEITKPDGRLGIAAVTLGPAQAGTPRLQAPVVAAEAGRVAAAGQVAEAGRVAAAGQAAAGQAAGASAGPAEARLVEVGPVAGGGVGPVVGGEGGPAADRGMLMVRGYGPAGTELASYLAARAGTWHRLARPGTASLRLTVYPAGADAEASGELILRRPFSTLAVDWRG
jgi:protein-L-isoaspartate(D-aspartate) O-methyltransferase